MLALQKRHSYQRRKTNNTCVLKVNNIVSVKSDSAPRLSWRKGKVEKLIYGDDNLVRGADVPVYQDNLDKTIVIRRPLQLLVPLEVTNIIHNDNEINEPTSEMISITECRFDTSVQFMGVSKLPFWAGV